MMPLLAPNRQGRIRNFEKLTGGMTGVILEIAVFAFFIGVFFVGPVLMKELGSPGFASGEPRTTLAMSAAVSDIHVETDSPDEDVITIPMGADPEETVQPSAGFLPSIRSQVPRDVTYEPDKDPAKTK
jgi:hypothetical protein